MPKKKITDDVLQDMKTLYVYGLLPCETIAERYGLSRQAVSTALKRVGVDTSKRKIIVKCARCGNPADKTRYEMRSNEHHFCSSRCYADYIVGDAYQEEYQKVRRWLSSSFIPPDLQHPYPFIMPSGKALVFASKEDMLEWKRTCLPKTVYSEATGKTITVTYREIMAKIGDAK